MLKEKKSIFLIHDAKIASRFNELLSENLDIETELEDYECNKLISVSAQDYQKALEEGFNISSLNYWDMSWVNAYGEPRPIGYISVMYSSLPKTREASFVWELLELPDYSPIDIRDYVEKLQAFLGGRSIKIKYNGFDNAIEFLVKGSLEDYELVKSQCEGFSYVIKNTPFVKTRFLEKDGTLIKTEKVEEKEEPNLKSYFNKSMFMDGLLRPESSNIVPKIDNDQDVTTGYKYQCRRYGVRDFNINCIVPYESLNIRGTFLLYEQKDYNHYWNNEKKEQTDCKSIMPFIMHDNGSFESKISIQDGKTVIVSTNINVIRNIIGWNFDGKSVRDGLFSGLSHEDCRGDFALNEYYKTISNRTRLLHYSESSNFFEVYELPNGWVVEDGISKLGNPKVFDDVNFDMNDKDLEEINSILALKTNIKGKYLAKKMDNSN